MLSSNDVRAGMILSLDGERQQVVDARHQKIGRGGAKLNVRMRNLATGATTDRSFPATRRFERVRTSTRKAQFLYSDSSGHHFLDMESFEELVLGDEMLGAGKDFLVEELIIELMADGDDILSSQFPATVECTVVQTDPGHRGDTATGVTKPAQLDTGLTVQVPLFISTGETIVVSTSSGQYLERARK